MNRWPKLSEKVYAILREVPKGKVITYGQIAKQLGSIKLARTVGIILHHNSDEELNPCYKVVNAWGGLSERYAFGGIEAQKIRLEQDGIEVKNYWVDLEKYGM